MWQEDQHDESLFAFVIGVIVGAALVLVGRWLRTL